MLDNEFFQELTEGATHSDTPLGFATGSPRCCGNVETPIPPILMYAAAIDGAPRGGFND